MACDLRTRSTHRSWHHELPKTQNEEKNKPNPIIREDQDDLAHKALKESMINPPTLGHQPLLFPPENPVTLLPSFADNTPHDCLTL